MGVFVGGNNFGCDGVRVLIAFDGLMSGYVLKKLTDVFERIVVVSK
jgi:hypothetical protein